MKTREEVEWVSAKVPSTDIQKLEEMARRSDRSRSAEVRRAIRAHIEWAEANDQEAAA